MPQATNNEGGISWSLARAADYEDLTLTIEGDSSDPYYLVVSSEGVRKHPTVKYGGEGLEIEREYLTPEGDSLVFSDHELGDVVYVRLTLINAAEESLSNVALVDRLPAGWEIENPRLDDRNTHRFFDERRWGIDHMNFRDDRLQVFGDIGRGRTVQVVYAARATLAGSFTIPSVHAEAMYDASTWSRNARREITIGGPWD